MNIPKEQRTIEAAFDEYRQWLDVIPDEQFVETPPGGGWSYAEVYWHILQADRQSFMAIEQCINGRGKKGRPNLAGRLTFLMGRVPRSKAPAAAVAADPAKKISKEEARNLIIKCRKRLAEIVPEVKNADQNSRIIHPRFGMLNAQQWLKFVRIHTLHHIKQLKRIQKNFLHR